MENSCPHLTFFVGFYIWSTKLPTSKINTIEIPPITPTNQGFAENSFLPEAPLATKRIPNILYGSIWKG